MNFENEYLLKLRKFVREKCAKECQFEDLEDKLLEGKFELKNYENWDQHNNQFECFHKCNSKNFEMGIFSLQTLGEYLKK